MTRNGSFSQKPAKHVVETGLNGLRVPDASVLEGAHAKPKASDQARNKKPIESTSSEEPSKKKAKREAAKGSEDNNKDKDTSKKADKGNKEQKKDENKQPKPGSIVEEVVKLPSEGVVIPGAAVGVGMRLAEKFGKAHVTQLVGDVDALARAREEALRRTEEKKKKKCAPC
jgi:hypothetical protein